MSTRDKDLAFSRSRIGIFAVASGLVAATWAVLPAARTDLPRLGRTVVGWRV